MIVNIPSMSSNFLASSESHLAFLETWPICVQFFMSQVSWNPGVYRAVKTRVQVLALHMKVT